MPEARRLNKGDVEVRRRRPQKREKGVPETAGGLSLSCLIKVNYPKIHSAVPQRNNSSSNTENSAPTTTALSLQLKSDWRPVFAEKRVVAGM